MKAHELAHQLLSGPDVEVEMRYYDASYGETFDSVDEVVVKPAHTAKVFGEKIQYEETVVLQ